MFTPVETGEKNQRSFDKIIKILDSYSFKKNKLIPILQAVQDEYRYLPEEVITFIANSLDLPPAKVFGVATFYTHFALKAKGKYIIKVCDGTACHVKNSVPLIEAIQCKLDLTNVKNTSDDMLFTLETVSCLGACGLAPVVVVNDDVHSLMTPRKVEELIDSIKSAEVCDDKSVN